MLITEILARNGRMYGNEIALIEREPARMKRSEITWSQFDEQANAVANATGAWLHEVPFTPRRVLAALQAQRGGRPGREKG